ncbi:uncharacterized protein V6R79_022002 [Siganus canaliculatus]
MPGHPRSAKPKKRKSSSEVRCSRKTSASRRRCKSPKRSSAAESSVANSPLERLSYISCECHQSAGRRRCSASPVLEGREGKENELITGLDLDIYRVNGTSDKQGPEDMDFEESGKNIFPDDDSNQILPVEQFFGNLDTLQDFPQRPTSARAPRESRRRHYYAPEDSEEEEGNLSSEQRDDRGDTS